MNWQCYLIACVACGAYSQRRINSTRLQCPGAETHKAGLARQKRRLAQGLHPQCVKPYCHWQIFPATQEEWEEWKVPAGVNELPGFEPGAI
eukprot:5781187-Amphidinium_carterae.1